MKPPLPSVRFNFQHSFRLAERNRIKDAVKFIFQNEGRNLTALDYVFCSDEFLLTLNQDYLQHDTFTDIITFDLSENKSSIIGEVYISVERVRENALHFDTSFLIELRRVIFHGALHLCGYRDKSTSDKQIMTAKEDFYLSKF